MFTSKDYVYEVYREKSFTGAAKKMFVSQPALSLSVKKTEEELGVELFDRSSSPIRLTEAGRAYIDAVEQIYAIEENLRNKISDINSLKSGSVAVGGANFICSCVLPDIIGRFNEKYPGITVNLTESNSEDLKEKALAGLLDAVIDYDFDDALFKSYPIKEEQVYLAAAKDSPIANRLASACLSASDIRKKSHLPTIELGELKGESFVLLKKGNDMGARAAKIFKDAELRPKIALWLDQLMTSYYMATSGIGLAFVTDTMILSSGHKSAVYFKINSPHAKRSLSIAHKKNVVLTRSLSRFIAAATENDF